MNRGIRISFSCSQHTTPPVMCVFVYRSLTRPPSVRSAINEQWCSSHALLYRPCFDTGYRLHGILMRGEAVLRTEAGGRLLDCLEASDHRSNHALDDDIANVDRAHGLVCWLQTDALIFFVETLKCCVGVVEQRDYHVPVLWIIVALNHDIVAIKDAVINHGFSFDAQNVGTHLVDHEVGRNSDGLVGLNGLDRFSGRDHAREWQNRYAVA